jgi:hypothetical protein
MAATQTNGSIPLTDYLQNSERLRFWKQDNGGMKHRVPVLLAIGVLALGITACNKPAAPEPAATPSTAKAQTPPEAKPAVASESKAPAVATPATPSASTNVLIFRNVRSWRRQVDFEEALTELGMKFDVKLSAEMATTDPAAYAFVIIPGAQMRDDYYFQYAESAERFNRYVTNGGTLVLELNGAERDGITLPGGVTMVSQGSTDNALNLPDHPILSPLGGKPIHANYASHGYLAGVPTNALVLATELVDGQPAMDRPTFIEYPYGAGRVIAACQCFHDQDGSGRGILMETVINYAAEKNWFTPKK